MHCFILFPYKSVRGPIWSCHKLGHGQPMVNIWINLVVLEHPMLHTKFQGHQPFGSGEKNFLRFLSYIGRVAILVMWPRPFEKSFVPPSHEDSIWNLASIGPVVSEKMLKEYGWQTDNGQTDRHRLVVLRLNVPVNNFSVMSGRSHRFLGN